MVTSVSDNVLNDVVGQDHSWHRLSSIKTVMCGRAQMHQIDKCLNQYAVIYTDHHTVLKPSALLSQLMLGT